MLQPVPTLFVDRINMCIKIKIGIHYSKNVYKSIGNSRCGWYSQYIVKLQLVQQLYVVGSFVENFHVNNIMFKWEAGHNTLSV